MLLAGYLTSTTFPGKENMSVAATVQEPPVFIKRAEAAKLLCVSVALLNKWARLKTGVPFYKFTKSPVYSRQEILDFIQASRQQ
jgi:hypothetical protein